MSKVNDGGPAFPKPLDPFPNVQDIANASKVPSSGMSLRDWFAGQALAGWLGSYGDTREHPATIPGGADRIAELSYQMADALLQSREATHG
jgi:hypothetical protein